MTNLCYEPVKNPRYNIHFFDFMLIFPINKDFISVWVLPMFYIQKMR